MIFGFNNDSTIVSTRAQPSRISGLFCFLGIMASVILYAYPAHAGNAVVAAIDLSEQRMRVYVGGVRRYTWSVSTARWGYRTPVGKFRPTILKRMHYSRKYDNSPMPHSIFFLGGYAVHGTYETKLLGRPASHGCIRLHPGNAKRLFGLIRQYGIAKSLIVISR